MGKLLHAVVAANRKSDHTGGQSLWKRQASRFAWSRESLPGLHQQFVDLKANHDRARRQLSKAVKAGQEHKVDKLVAIIGHSRAMLQLIASEIGRRDSVFTAKEARLIKEGTEQ